jgi:hypothetical protein
MAGYDPFGELLPGEPILPDDGVTTEGIFPLEPVDVTVVQLAGTVETTAEISGGVTQTHSLTANQETVAEVVGTFILGLQLSGQAETTVQIVGVVTQTHTLGAAAETAVQVAAAAGQTHALTGQPEAVAEVVGGFIIATLLVGAVQTTVQVDGSTLTVTTEVFIGWGIPVGVS